MRSLNGARLLAVALALLVLPAGANAQNREKDIDRLAEALPTDYVSRIVAMIDDAESRGVPAELLFREALEGTVKRAPRDRIVETVELYAAELTEARRIVGPDVDEESLDLASRALAEGMDPDVVRSIAQGEAQDFELFILAVEQLMHRGVKDASAHETMREALDRGYSGDQLLDVSAAVRRLMRDGASGEEAISTVMKELLADPPRTIPPDR